MMQIFGLDKYPVRAAWQHTDRHVLSCLNEYAQLMSTYIDDKGQWTKEMFKPVRSMNPKPLNWLNRDTVNYWWLYLCWKELFNVYTHMYEKFHKNERLIPLLNPKLIVHRGEIGLPEPDDIVTETFPIPEMEFYITHKAAIFAKNCSVYEYIQLNRMYVLDVKNHLCKWSKRNTPTWAKVCGVQLIGGGFCQQSAMYCKEHSPKMMVDR